ncbi:MAG: DUF2188 domain-containing protein [Candidatus Cyclobacteriaceae bacterium M3_2C_046]
MNIRTYHITPTYTGWKTNLNDQMILILPTEEEIISALEKMNWVEKPGQIVVHQSDGSIREMGIVR